MTTVVIYFVGLIAHLTFSPVTPGPNPFKMEVAALVVSKDASQMPNHHPQLIVSTSAVLPSINPFTMFKQDAGLDHYDLTSVGVVRVSGLSTAPMQVPSSNFSDVIALDKATGQSQLSQDVLSETSGNVWSFIELEGNGQLSVAGYFPNAGKHSQMPKTVCVPSLVQYTGSAPEGIIEFVSSNGHHLRIDLKTTPPPKIYIANLSTSGGMPGDFKEYAKLMNAADAGTWTKDGLCKVLDPSKPIFSPSSIGIFGDGMIMTGDSVDCTNTHFP
jgi:hypothetical protein